MVVAYWIVAGLLAAANLAAGSFKISRSREKLVSSGMAWADDFSPAAVKLIGAVEILGALGLVIPPLTGIAPILAPIAAIGLVVVQLGAIVTHARRREMRVLPANIVLLLLGIAAAVLGFLVWT